MSSVALRKLVKQYGSAAPVVKGIDLEIADREFVVLVGPSGCGKSTSLRMIAGLEDISSGEILIGDRIVNDLPPRERDIAMVFQNYALYQHMTVFENLAFGLKNKKVAMSEIQSAIKHASSILGLDALLDRKPSQLSGGQQQRVALGRCIVRNPQVFLFDEPLSNLDAKLRAQMRIELKRLRERVNTTSIFVTHDQVEAMTLGDRVVVMKDGVIQQAGTPVEVYSKPANQFVASFIGSPAMNFVNARALGNNQFGTDWIALGSNQVPRGNETLVMGIRPEHIGLGQDAPGISAQGRIEMIENLGSELIATIRVGSDSIAVGRIDPLMRISPNDVVTIKIDPEKIHFFNSETGQAQEIQR